MRAMKFVFAAAVAVVAVACNGGQPRIYRVAIDASPLDSLPPSCFFNNQPQSVRTISTNLRGGGDWSIWDGAEGKQYLDTNGLTIGLGNADPVQMKGLIESTGDKVFSGQLVRQGLPNQPGKDPNYTFTETWSMVVTWDDLGATPKGTIDAENKYACTVCGNNNDGKIADCAAKLNFTSHRIDATNEYIYQP